MDPEQQIKLRVLEMIDGTYMKAVDARFAFEFLEQYLGVPKHGPGFVKDLYDIALGCEINPERLRLLQAYGAVRPDGTLVPDVVQAIPLIVREDAGTVCLQVPWLDTAVNREVDRREQIRRDDFFQDWLEHGSEPDGPSWDRN